MPHPTDRGTLHWRGIINATVNVQGMRSESAATDAQRRTRGVLDQVNPAIV